MVASLCKILCPGIRRPVVGTLLTVRALLFLRSALPETWTWISAGSRIGSYWMAFLLTNLC